MAEDGLDPAWPEHAALFLDLDGTLLEFAETPDGVEVTERLRALLRRLDRVEHGAIAKVNSGPTEARWNLPNVEAVLAWLEVNVPD